MEFDEKFKNYSNSDLLRIIENPNDYQLQAVETAKNIISERQLSEMEIKIAKNELENKKQEKSRKEQQKKEVEDKVKNVGKSIFDQINPIQKKLPSSEKVIRTISILFGGLFLIYLYREFGMLRFMLADSFAEWDFSTVLYFLPLIALPTAVILFYLKKKIGWLLLTIFLTYSAVSAIGSMILALKWKPSGIEALDFLFQPSLPLTYLLGFLFFSGVIWTISRKNIRTIYSISNRTVILTISIVVFIVVLGLKTFF